MNYLEKAKLFGHDLEALKKGDTITSMVTVNSLEDFKKILAGNHTAEQSENFSESLMKNYLTAQTLHLHPAMINLMNHVYGTYDLTKADKDYAAKLFPIKVLAMSGNDVVINKDIVQGPNAAPYVINANNLTFAGGSITVISTSLTVFAQNLIMKSGGSKPYHIGILGNTGATGNSGTNGTPYSSPAANGSNSSAPTPGICTGASNGGNGTNGSKGNPGSAPSGSGADGQANLPANITIKAYDPSSSSPLVVFTQSGAGGSGGPGGNGGPGQQGGNGGNGCDSGCEGTDGGNGGNGGDGGDGSNGGNGGNGIAGVDINISFPQINKTMLQTISQAAPFGAGGAGGKAGVPGDPGSGGNGGKHKSNGTTGSGGGAGKGGKSGNAGTKTGAAGNFNINYTS